jgi:hypothetical protein
MRQVVNKSCTTEQPDACRWWLVGRSLATRTVPTRVIQTRGGNVFQYNPKQMTNALQHPRSHDPKKGTIYTKFKTLQATKFCSLKVSNTPGRNRLNTFLAHLLLKKAFHLIFGWKNR